MATEYSKAKKETVETKTIEKQQENRWTQPSRDLVALPAPAFNSTDAQKLATEIEKRLTQLEREKSLQREEREDCIRIIESLIDQLRERNVALEKVSEAPPRLNAGALIKKKKRGTRGDLEDKVVELVEELHTYEHREKQVTHKYNVSKVQGGTALNLAEMDHIPQNFGEEEKEILKSKARDPFVVATRKLVENTRAERHVCLVVLSDLGTQLKKRREKLRDSLGPVKLKQDAKPAGVPSNSSVLVKKLLEVQQLIAQVLDLQAQVEKVAKQENVRSRHTIDSSLKAKTREVKTLSKRLQDAEMQRDKFKTLLQNSQARKTRLTTTRNTGPVPRQRRYQPTRPQQAIEKAPVKPTHITPQTKTSKGKKRREKEQAGTAVYDRKQALVKPMMRRVEGERTVDKAPGKVFLTQ